MDNLLLQLDLVSPKAKHLSLSCRDLNAVLMSNTGYLNPVSKSSRRSHFTNISSRMHEAVLSLFLYFSLAHDRMRLTLLHTVSTGTLIEDMSMKRKRPLTLAHARVHMCPQFK